MSTFLLWPVKFRTASTLFCNRCFTVIIFLGEYRVLRWKKTQDGSCRPTVGHRGDILSKGIFTREDFVRLPRARAWQKQNIARNSHGSPRSPRSPRPSAAKNDALSVGLNHASVSFVLRMRLLIRHAYASCSSTVIANWVVHARTRTRSPTITGSRETNDERAWRPAHDEQR